MSRYDLKIMFSEEMLVSYANLLLQKAGSRYSVASVKDHGERWIRFDAKGPRGNAEIVAPFGLPREGTIFFRSLLRMTNPAKGGKWLINGQASTGTSEIAHFGENGVWMATSLDRLRAYLGSGKEGILPDRAPEFDRWVSSRVVEAEKMGLVREQAETIDWGNDGERAPFESGPSGISLS